MEHQTYILGVTPETLSSLPGNSWCTERTHSHNLPSDPCGTGLPPPSKKKMLKNLFASTHLLTRLVLRSQGVCLRKRPF